MSKETKKKGYPTPMSSTALVFWTGLFAGIFWGMIGYICYIFSLTEIRPNVFLEPWALGNWKNEWIGTIISILLMGVFSIPTAFIYYWALKKWNGIWLGLTYGLVIFLLVFIVLNPLFPSIKPLFDLNRDTIITSICLFLVYGLFIGYSINYEYVNTKGKEKEAAT